MQVCLTRAFKGMPFGSHQVLQTNQTPPLWNLWDVYISVWVDFKMVDVYTDLCCFWFEHERHCLVVMIIFLTVDHFIMIYCMCHVFVSYRICHDYVDVLWRFCWLAFMLGRGWWLGRRVARLWILRSWRNCRRCCRTSVPWRPPPCRRVRHPGPVAGGPKETTETLGGGVGFLFFTVFLDVLIVVFGWWFFMYFIFFALEMKTLVDSCVWKALKIGSWFWFLGFVDFLQWLWHPQQPTSKEITSHDKQTLQSNKDQPNTKQKR